jgi:hypothetical protein
MNDGWKISIRSLSGMVTHIYICNRCRGPIESRTFEIEHKDIRSAEQSPIPVCPICGSSEHVTRFFGHNIFLPAKSNRVGAPARFVPLDTGRQKAVVSIGMRIEEDERADFEESLRDIVELAPDDDTAGPERDLAEEKLGLKKGTIDRALFDIRQNQMLEELAQGRKIAGFYLPITGETNN